MSEPFSIKPFFIERNMNIKSQELLTRKSISKSIIIERHTYKEDNGILSNELDSCSISSKSQINTKQVSQNVDSTKRSTSVQKRVLIPMGRPVNNSFIYKPVNMTFDNVTQNQHCYSTTNIDNSATNKNSNNRKSNHKHANDLDSDSEIIEITSNESVTPLSKSKTRYPVSQDENLSQSPDKINIELRNFKSGQDTPKTKVLNWYKKNLLAGVTVISDSEDYTSDKSYQGSNSEIVQEIIDDFSSNCVSDKNEQEIDNLELNYHQNDVESIKSNENVHSKDPLVKINEKYKSVVNYNPNNNHIISKSIKLSSVKDNRKMHRDSVVLSKVKKLETTPTKAQKQMKCTPLSPESMKSEFYSYLKINTNPLERKSGDITQTRRSNRVKNLSVQFEKSKGSINLDIKDKYKKTVPIKAKRRLFIPPPPEECYQQLDFDDFVTTFCEINNTCSNKSEKVLKNDNAGFQKENNLHKINHNRSKTKKTITEKLSEDKKKLNKLKKPLLGKIKMFNFNRITRNTSKLKQNIANKMRLNKQKNTRKAELKSKLIQKLPSFKNELEPSKEMIICTNGKENCITFALHNNNKSSISQKETQTEINPTEFFHSTPVLEKSPKEQYLTQLDLENTQVTIATKPTTEEEFLGYDVNKEFDDANERFLAFSQIIIGRLSKEIENKKEDESPIIIEDSEETVSVNKSFSSESLNEPNVQNNSFSSESSNESNVQNYVNEINTDEQTNYIPLNQNIKVKSFHKSLMKISKTKKSTLDLSRSSLFESTDDNDSSTRISKASPEKVLYEIDINERNGSVLFTYYINYVLVIVQEHIITFWKQTALGNILGSQVFWLAQGSIKRLFDYPGCVSRQSLEVVLSCDNSIAYVEMWAKDHKWMYRECAIADIFVTVYSHKGQGTPDRRVLQLENIKGYGKDVNFVVIKTSREIIMSWFDTFSNPNKTCIRCYELAADFQTVSSVREMKTVLHRVLSLHNINGCEDLVLGAGEEQMSIWNFRHGYLVTTLNFSEAPVKTPENKCLHVHCDTGILFLIQQIEGGILRLVAVNGFSQEKKLLQHFIAPHNYNGLKDISMESGLIMAFYSNGWISWNSCTGEMLSEIEIPTGVLLKPSEKYLIAINNDFQVRVQHILSYILNQ